MIKRIANDQGDTSHLDRNGYAGVMRGSREQRRRRVSISSDLGKFLAGQHSVSIVVDGVEEGCIG